MSYLNTRMQQRDESGFTLIELLVVIAILAVLAGVVVFAVGQSQDNADEVACNTEASALRTASKAADTANDVNTRLGKAAETWEDYLDSADLYYFAATAAQPPVVTAAVTLPGSCTIPTV